MITIFTPTYNRKELLPRLYKSLCIQTCKDFEWIVIDDGSDDGTEKLIKEYVSKSDFSIIYYYQENKGKHIAHNKAVQFASGEAFFCLDSDDWLENDKTIFEIAQTFKEKCTSTNCAGIISYKENKEGEILGNEFPKDVQYTSSVDLVSKYCCNGERNIIYKTELLTECFYPHFDGEYFCPDSYISDKLSLNYYFYLRRSADEICEYQNDGLSNNFKKLMAHNSKAFAICNMQLIDLENSFLKRIKRSTYYWGFLFYNFDSEIQYKGSHKFSVYAATIPGYILSRYYKFFRLKN